MTTRPIVIVIVIQILLGHQQCIALLNVDLGLTRANELFALGPHISSAQYMELFHIYVELNMTFDLDSQSFTQLDSIMQFYTDLQDQLLNDAIRIGVDLMLHPNSRSKRADFEAICSKVDVFRTKTESGLSFMRPLLRHMEDGAKFQHLEQLRQRALLIRKRRPKVEQIFQWLFPCFRISDPQPVSNHVSLQQFDEQEQERHDFMISSCEVEVDAPALPPENESSDSELDNEPRPDSEAHRRSDIEIVIHIEPRLRDNGMNLDDTALMSSGDSLQDAMTVFLTTTSLFESGLLPLSRYLELRRLVQNSLLLNGEEIEILMPFNDRRDTLHLEGYSDEECERFLQLLEEHESVLNLVLYQMQALAKDAGLMTPKQIQEWRQLHTNFLGTVRKLNIDDGILQEIISVMKKVQKNPEDKAVEKAFLSRGRQAARFIEESARMQRSMEIRRRLPNCWQTYCDLCLNPFPSGEGLSPIQLLEFDPETRSRMEKARIVTTEQARDELEALQDPVTTEESSERKAAVLLSAIEESELFGNRDAAMPNEIVSCGICGYRICRVCVEQCERSSACRCPICAETLLIPTMATLRAYRPSATLYK